jgi:hypothetical protein
MPQLSPVAHWPVGLGVVRTLQGAARLETCCPPHPAHVLSGGRVVDALLLARLDGHHARYKVGARLEERGRFPLLQPGLPRWWAAVRGGGLSGRRVSARPASKPSPGGGGPLGDHESPLVYAFLSL